MFKNKQDIKDFLLEVGQDVRPEEHHLSGMNYPVDVVGYFFEVKGPAIKGSYSIVKTKENIFWYKWYDKNKNWQDQEWGDVTLEQMVNILWEKRRKININELYKNPYLY